ncbi:MAG TPA: two-component regulator propeller domain-containing protein [Ohtaekwangia sp.]
MLQDKHGFMWFGTRNGLNKYDGYSFTVFKNIVDDPHSIGDDRIADIAEDSHGNIWIATLNGGLDMFDWRQEKFIHYKNDPADPASIPNNNLHCITFDYSGNLWIGTAGSGLCMFNRSNNTFVQYLHDEHNPNSLPENSINEVLEDSEHNLWISTVYSGLSRFDRETGTFTHYRHDDNNSKSLAYDQIEVLFKDSKNRIWVGTRNGLDWFDGKEFHHYKHEPNNDNSLANNVVLSLGEDSYGNLWIGTENGGLSILTPETRTFYNYKQDDVDRLSLNNNSIWSVFRDTQGNMWLGTFSGGINFVNNAIKFTHYRHSSSPTSLSHNSIWAIYEDSKTNLWIGTDGGGLNLYDRQQGTFTAYKHKAPSGGMSGNYVLTIAEDRNGNIWAGTWGDGITVFNKAKNTFQYFKYDANNPDGIGAPNVWIIYKDKHEKMWVGTYSGGVDIYDEENNRFTHFTNDPADPSSLSNNTICYFFEDSRDNMWVATNYGLNLLRKGEKKFTRYIHDDRVNSISNNRVLCMLEDVNGNYWIGTDIGLNYFNPKTSEFTNYYVNNGLPDNTINGLQMDKNNNLWISTNNGIACFNTSKKTFSNFNVSDGLQSPEFKKGSLKSKTGKIYFGGPAGLNEFTPEEIRTDSFESPLRLTGFDIFNQRVPISSDETISTRIEQSIIGSSEVRLSYEQTVFSIHFASLNYNDPEGRLYTYMLEGFDTQWNTPGPLHSATYTNLDPGTYTFKVRGTKNNGQWSDTTTELKITIIPPFWKTWWFNTLAILLVGSLIVLIFILRTRSIRRTNRELALAVDEKTKEINDKNKILFQQREELAAQNEELLQSHEEISAQRDLVAKQNATLESEVEKRTRELVEYNHQLEQFAFIAAHNLRAPVARILGLGNLLDFSGQTETQREQIYPKLIGATRELDVVVKDLNTILYLKKNSDSVITLIDLPTEVALIIENLEHEISITQATIETDFSHVTTIRSVKPYLDSVIYNLLSNAIKYRHPDRKPVILIKTRKIDNEICLSVSDNGLGIDVDLFQDKLFTLYSRFHLHVEGKGMGLYLVKTQIEAMGGRIEVESKVGVGTTFSVYFKL